MSWSRESLRRTRFATSPPRLIGLHFLTPSTCCGDPKSSFAISGTSMPSGMGPQPTNLIASSSPGLGAPWSVGPWLTGTGRRLRMKIAPRPHRLDRCGDSGM